MTLSIPKQERLLELSKTPRCADLSAPVTDYECILGLVDLLEVAKPKSVLEIGSYRGVSTEVFLLYAKRVVAVDPWNYPDMIYKEFTDRCGAYSNLNICRGRSPRALLPFGREFDLCYIDGDHSHDAVVADIVAACWVVKYDGWIGGHDYSMLSVQDAVHEELRPPQLFRDDSWLVKMGT